MKARWDLTILFIIGAIGVGYGLGHVMPAAQNFTTEGAAASAVTEKFDEAKFKKEKNPYPTAPAPKDEKDAVAKNRDKSLDTVDEAREYLKKFVASPMWDRMIQSSIDKGQVVQKTQNGKFIYTKETLTDGTTTDRTYRSDGSLSFESLDLPTGEKVQRGFFETGKLKLVNITSKNGAITSVIFDSSGAITVRNIQFLDGARIWTEYDDHGAPTQSYWISAPPAFASQPI